MMLSKKNWIIRKTPNTKQFFKKCKWIIGFLFLCLLELYRLYTSQHSSKAFINAVYMTICWSFYTSSNARKCTHIIILFIYIIYIYYDRCRFESDVDRSHISLTRTQKNNPLHNGLWGKMFKYILMMLYYFKYIKF